MPVALEVKGKARVKGRARQSLKHANQVNQRQKSNLRSFGPGCVFWLWGVAGRVPPSRHLRNAVGHRDVGPCGPGVSAEQPWITVFTEDGVVLPKLALAGAATTPCSEAASVRGEGRCGDTARWAALPRL